jgi:hypothetical protein
MAQQLAQVKATEAWRDLTPELKARVLKNAQVG